MSIYISPKKAAQLIGLPEDSPLLKCITWAAFEYAYQSGHYTWRNDPEIPAIRELFAKKFETNIYSAFYKFKEALNADPEFMSGEDILNYEYFKWAVDQTKRSSWIVLAPGTMSSVYDLKAFLDGKGEASWSWEIPAGTNNGGVKPTRIKVTNLR